MNLSYGLVSALDSGEALFTAHELGWHFTGKVEVWGAGSLEQNHLGDMIEIASHVKIMQ